MAANKKANNGKQRNRLAYITLMFSAGAITLLAIFVIKNNSDEALTVFNIVLPVFASWVGTILAFYFGRENFESANEQVRKLVNQISPDELVKKPVTSIMRSLLNMTYFQIPQGKDDKDIKLSELIDKFSTAVNRLPIIDADKKPKYIVHRSRIDNYLSSGGKADDTLDVFISKRKADGFVFGSGEGFVVVSEKTTVDSAKQQMEALPSCQDIFVTKDGTPKEPLTGWISNIRMGKQFEA